MSTLKLLICFDTAICAVDDIGEVISLRAMPLQAPYHTCVSSRVSPSYSCTPIPVSLLFMQLVFTSRSLRTSPPRHPPSDPWGLRRGAGCQVRLENRHVPECSSTELTLMVSLFFCSFLEASEDTPWPEPGVSFNCFPLWLSGGGDWRPSLSDMVAGEV